MAEFDLFALQRLLCVLHYTMGTTKSTELTDIYLICNSVSGRINNIPFFPDKLPKYIFNLK